MGRAVRFPEVKFSYIPGPGEYKIPTFIDINMKKNKRFNKLENLSIAIDEGEKINHIENDENEIEEG